ncbi:MAG: polyphosphate polymerase domain-containing protein [Pseudomonadota bacterium]
MVKHGQTEIPSLLTRYELKYQIPLSLVESVSQFVSAYCRLDRYSQESPDMYYQVVSLYFDSPSYTFLKRRLHRAENRFNMRIRSYGTPSGLPCFFEVKEKRNRIVKKYRGQVRDEGWPMVFGSAGVPLNHDTCTGKDCLELFESLALAYDAAPKVLTRYWRKAYISEVDDYARVTFDRNLMFQARDTYSVIPDDDAMVNYDNASIFDENASVILELKCCCSRVPMWMLDLIRCFNLQQGRFSKYAAGMAAVFQSQDGAALGRIPAMQCMDTVRGGSNGLC